jgi:ABC-2 type transport system permease protein
MYKEIAFTSFKEEVIYRVEFLISLISFFTRVVVLWFLWNAIFTAYGAETLKGFTLPMMITYISISTILSIFSRSEIEYDIEGDVKTGFISVLLTKPFSYPIFYFFKEIGKTGFSLLLKGSIVFVFSLIFLGIMLPSTPIFFVSVVLGFFINFLLVLLTGLWSFWSSGSIWGIRFSRNIISEIMSGSLIPLYLFPLWLKNIANVLPFQAIYSTPLLIYIGQLTDLDLLNSIIIQIFWIVFLGGLSFIVWKRAEKKTLSYGG